jgi:thiosulfate/3-mercaptopyruvate sulfurtransferase
MGRPRHRPRKSAQRAVNVVRLKHPDSLVGTDWLAEHLEDPNLRVFDATIQLSPAGPESGRPAYEAGHVPGAAFLDHAADLSDSSNPVPYARLTPDRLAHAFAGAGVAADSRVVVYSTSHPMWATRVFWLLRGIGFDAAAVLDGGFARWQGEGRPVEKGSAAYPTGGLAARPRPQVWADRDEVRAAIGDGAVCTINALPRALYEGATEHHYGRPGRIAGSRSVPFSKIVDTRTGCFADPSAWQTAFAAAGAFERARVITYCGGGISATVDAFALLQLGHPDVAVYDGSLLEWSADPELPMETG